MAAQPIISIAGAKAMLNALTALFTGGAGTLKIFTGSAPATTLTADSGTLLSTLTLSSTAFPASTNATSNGLATATANAITADTSAAATGTAGYFRAKTNGGVVLVQGTCGTSAADFIMNTTSITAGDTVACSSWLITLPCGDGAS